MHVPHEEASLRANAERLADIFTDLQRSFVINLSKELARGNVSYVQYLLLGFLAQQQPAPSMSEVAARMRHTTAAATGLVDRLEKLGYARRQTAAEDRRKVFVHITQKGLELVGRTRSDMADNLMQLMGHLNADEQSAWLTIYEKILPHCPK
jgi:DNA-binding MarR family transcriptional regulator